MWRDPEVDRFLAVLSRWLKKKKSRKSRCATIALDEYSIFKSALIFVYFFPHSNLKKEISLIFWFDLVGAGIIEEKFLALEKNDGIFRSAQMKKS